MDDMDIEFDSNTSSSVTPVGCPRQQSLQHLEKEERLARLLIQDVLPPFANTLHLKALVVYQADQAKTDSFLINKNYFRSGADNPSVSSAHSSTGVEAVSSDLFEAVDEHTPLFDSGFIEPSTRTPQDELSSSNNLDTDFIGFPGGETSSKRKRKLYIPCKIPQSHCERMPVESPSPVVPVSIDQPLATASPLRATSHAPPPVVSPSPSTINDPANAFENRMDQRVTVDVLPNQNGITQEGIVLPVSAVTLFPRLNVFPVSMLSTLPRPILPRGGLDKSVTVSSLMCLSAVKQSTVMTTTNTSVIPSIHPAIQLNVPSPSNPKESPPPLKRIALSPVACKIQRQTQSSKHGTNIGTVSISSNGESENNSANRRYGKSFVCNQCHKDFASLSLLCTHTFSVHRGFRCTICRAQFTQRSNLQRHSLRHVGFKPFVCKVCEKAYYRKDHLVRHIEVSHPGCDPRISLTVKLSSAECLDYLEKQHQDSTLQEGEIDASVQSFVETSQELTSTVTGEPGAIKLG